MEGDGEHYHETLGRQNKQGKNNLIIIIKFVSIQKKIVCLTINLLNIIKIILFYN